MMRTNAKNIPRVTLSMGGPVYQSLYARLELLQCERSVARPGVFVHTWTKTPRQTEAEKRFAELERYIGKPELRRGRGRPFRGALAVLAYDDWLADPRTSWGQLARKYGFAGRRTLECAIRRLKRVLKREAIRIPERAKQLPS